VPIPKVLARFNRAVTNPVARVIAGWLPPFAIVTHRGRASGTVYRTPVFAFRTRGGLAVALTYGADTDWVENVLTAGDAVVERLGGRYRYTAPRIVRGEAGMRMMPWLVRAPLRLFGVTEFLRLMPVR
jgi:deazaflavin-dependent oxidoreductase (nitroreductase family)